MLKKSTFWRKSLAFMLCLLMMQAITAFAAEDTPSETDTLAAEANEATLPNAVDTDIPAATESSTQAFVKRLYSLCLDREADTEGLNYWVPLLENKSQTGASVAKGFLFSEEMELKNLSDSDFIRILYLALMDREPDAEGAAYWASLMDTGLTKYYIFAGFANSAEFQAICSSYNIERGTYKSSETVDQNPQVTAYISRLYRLCLGRKAEYSGLDYWTGMLLNNSSTASSVAWNFLNSTEFSLQNNDDTEYIKVLYRVFFDREYDSEGLAYWLGRLDVGLSRRYLAAGFAGSEEFSLVCAAYGVTRGSIDIVEFRDKSSITTEYITNIYTQALGRKPSTDEINYWCDLIYNKSYTGIEIAKAFLSGSEYETRQRSNTEYVQDIYRALLIREPAADELSYWSGRLDSGKTRASVLTSISTSDEFNSICSARSITIIRDGWNTVSGNVYYYVNAVRQTGWLNLNGQRYYLNPSNSGARATGWNYVDGYKYYFDADGVLQTDLRSILGTQGSYLIKVNKQMNCITIYANDGFNGYIIPVVSFVCSTGNDTPIGTFSIPARYRWKTLMGPCYAQWVTRVVDSIYFHSLFSYTPGDNLSIDVYEFNRLGQTASHGCIRLQAGDAKWIYDNCANGTTIQIYNSSVAGPYDKPVAPVLPEWHTWDPSDPTAYYKCQQKGCH